MATSNIQIGDYVYLTVKNETYRYYIVKIQSKFIEIAQINNRGHILMLFENEVNIWQIVGVDAKAKPHTVTFIKNVTETRYFERDFTQAPTKIFIIDKDTPASDGSYNGEFDNTHFVELSNGIILHQSGETGNFNFTDYTNTEKFCYPIFDTTPRVEHGNNFLKDVAIFEDFRNFDLMELDGEIYLHRFHMQAILKINLNDLTFYEYHTNSNLGTVKQLKNKKILCRLPDNFMYILNTVTNTKIDIDYFSLSNGIKNTSDLSFGTLGIHQLANEDIILEDESKDFYRVNITNGTISKLGSVDHLVNIMAVLQNDDILLSSCGEGQTILTIEIWNFVTNQITEIFTLDNEEEDDRLVAIRLLQNGDVLFNNDKIFYLFENASQEVLTLPSFDNIYSQIEDISTNVNFKQLRNGNLIINNGHYLSVMEFPLSQREIDKQSYDSVKLSIKDLVPDIKNVIRDYL